MNASWYSEDEYTQSRESTLQQIEHAYSTRQKVQTNPNSLSGKQHYNKLQQHTRQAIEKEVNLLHRLNLFFQIFLTGFTPMQYFLKDIRLFLQFPSIDNTLTVM
jgi:hypothetical protein